MLEFKCHGLSPAASICIHKQCNKNAFICNSVECCPVSFHQNCRIIQVQQFFHHYENQRLRQSNLLERIQQFYDNIVIQLKNDASTFSQWTKEKFIKQRLLLHHKSQAETLTGKYLGELVDGWINCDEDFCEEVNFCLDLTNKSIGKELQEIRDIYTNLKRRIDQGKNPRQSRNSATLSDINSTILWKEEDLTTLLKILTPQMKIKEINILYKALQSKFSANIFHEACDGKSNTLVLAKTSKNKIIGGFTPVSWQSDLHGKFKTDSSSKSFLFDFNKEEKYPVCEKQFAIQCNYCCGPIFGRGALWISENSNSSETYWSQIPTTYRPAGKQWSEEAYAQFIGAQKYEHFFIEEWEVFEVIVD